MKRKIIIIPAIVFVVLIALFFWKKHDNASYFGDQGKPLSGQEAYR